MFSRRTILKISALIAAATPLVAAGTSLAADWPERPVRILVSFPPGGSSDLVARLLAEEMGKSLGQQFVVENKPGAAGTIAATELKKAAADGYTIMLSNLTPFNVAPVQFPETPYDPIRDFTHIGYIGAVHLGLFVRPGLETASLKDFVAKAKAAPDTIDYGTSGVGSWGHVFSAAFQGSAGVKLSHIPYKGSGPMQLDFRADVVPAIFDAVPQNLPAVQDGTAIPLAVSATERLETLPDVPTFIELGYDISAENWLGFSGPAGIEPTVSAKLSEALAAALATEKVGAKFKSWGVVRKTMSSADFAAYVARQSDIWAPMVKAAGK